MSKGCVECYWYDWALSINKQRQYAAAGFPCACCGNGSKFKTNAEDSSARSDSTSPVNFGINADVRALLARYFHASSEQMDQMQAVTIEAGNGQFMRATVRLASDEPKEAGQ